MSLDYTGTDRITLREGEGLVPVRWNFAACTTATANDGSLPYGTTVASASLAVYDPAGTSRLTQVLETGTLQVGGTGLYVTAQLNYPAAVVGPPVVAEGPPGQYDLYLTLTLSSAAVLVFHGPPLQVTGVP